MLFGLWNENTAIIHKLVSNKPYMQIQKEDIKQEVFDLYDDYAHNRLSRRDFMEKLSAYAVGSITVPALMSFLMPDYKNSIQVTRV